MSEMTGVPRIYSHFHRWWVWQDYIVTCWR